MKSKKTYLHRILFIFLLAVTALWATPHPPEGILQSPPLYVANEILVKFKPGTWSNSKSYTILAHGGQELRNLGNDWEHVQLPAGQTVDQAVVEYRNDPSVEYAQPNFIYHTLVLPNDTNYGQLWGLNNTAQTITAVQTETLYTNNLGTSGKDMSLPTAWDRITNCNSVVVAVIDSGVNYNHGDLSANMWSNPGNTCFASGSGTSGCDFVNSDTDPMDLNGHGTHLAGTIGAVGNNATGSTGVCWNVKIMAVRVMDHTGAGTTANIVSGVNFAVNNGAKVINLSLGSTTSNNSNYDASFNTAITSAKTSDVVVVVAAGNDGVDQATYYTYPCKYSQDNIVCVGAVDQSYTLTTFSNYDSTATASSRAVDIVAPGANIRSTWAGS